MTWNAADSTFIGKWKENIRDPYNLNVIYNSQV